MAKAKLDLVAACKALEPARKSWRTTATADQLAEMEKLRGAFQRREVIASFRQIHGVVQEVLGLRIGRNALMEFLNEGRPSQPAQR